MTELKQDMLLEIHRLEKELEFYKTHHMTPLIEVNEHYKHWNNKLSEQLKEAETVIQFYATLKDRDRNEPNLRREFGCGCCAGINGPTEDSENDFESTVQGLTAREYLEKYK